MKVMLLNGSPHKTGCTYTGLLEMSKVFEAEGITCEWVWVGNKPIIGCIGCGSCKKTGVCISKNDILNETVEKFKECDALVIGSPVHYAAASGAITSFLDRFFYSSDIKNLQFKVGASIVSCRRGGATAAFDQLNKYFTISQMPIVSSSYWNQIHGNSPAEVMQDLEGIRTVKVLAHNMSYMMKALKLAKENNLPLPTEEPPARTNFIR